MKRILTASLTLLFFLCFTNQSKAQTWGNTDSRLVPISHNLENGYITESPPTTTVIDGNYLYFTDYYGFHVYNISNPEAPVKISTLPIPGKALHFVISDNFAYVCNEMGVCFVNISNPVQPILETFRPVDFQPYRVFVEQDMLYLAAADGVYAYSLGEAHNMNFIGSIEIPTATTIMAGFTKQDNYIYFVNQGYLYVIDASNPQMMFTVYTTEFTGGGSCWGNLQIQNNILYIATTLRLHVYYIANPKNPILLYADLPTTHTIYQILVEGNRMVLNHINNRYFTILDISNPSNPIALFKHDGSWYHGFSKLGTLKNNILYAMDAGQEGYNGYTIHLIDISVPTNPIHKSSFASFPGYTRSVSLLKKNNQTYAIVGQSNGNTDAGSGLIRILNVTHPDEPYQESVIEIGSDIVSVTTLNENWIAVTSGNYSLPYHSILLSLVNLENISNPYVSDNFQIGNQVGIYNNSNATSIGNMGIVVSTYKMILFKESQGSVSVLSNSAIYGGHALGVFANNQNYAFVAGGSYGFQMYNISNPTSPFMINYHQTIGVCWDVYVDNGIACVAAQEGGLAVYDVSQNMIIPLAQVNTIGKATSVVMLNNTAYVGMMDGRIQMFDITNPAQPVSKGWYLTNGTAISDMIIDLAPGKSHLYVANELSMPIYQMDYFVGIPEAQDSSFEVNVYPNPVKDKAFIWLMLDVQSKVEARLYNQNGQLVSCIPGAVVPAGSSQLELNVAELPKGIYMLEIITGNARTTKKVMINN